MKKSPTAVILESFMARNALLPKPHRLATLIIDVEGDFVKLKAGTVVKAQHVSGSSYTIERLKWRGSKVPLANRLCGIPRSALRFHVPEVIVEPHRFP